jgi:hypothetical protein
VRDFAVMKVRGVLGMLCCVAVLGASAAARAEKAQQFVLVDATFTAATNNTMSSEYAVAPLEGAPANWRSPIDYAAGSLHVRIQVLEKPSEMKTLCNVCLKNNDVLTCQPYPPAYSKPGVYKSDAYFSDFWQFSVYDWTKPVERVNVVVKDENGRFVQGNPAYFPTKMHVTVTVVPPGERFIETDPLAGDDSDAGVVDNVPGAPAGPATGMASNASTAGVAGVVASGGVAGTTAAAAGASAAGSGAPLAGPITDRSIRDYIDEGSSCAVMHARPKARYGVAVSLSIVALCLWGFARTWRRTRRYERSVRSHGRHM